MQIEKREMGGAEKRRWQKVLDKHWEQTKASLGALNRQEREEAESGDKNLAENGDGEVQRSVRAILRNGYTNQVAQDRRRAPSA